MSEDTNTETQTSEASETSTDSEGKTRNRKPVVLSHDPIFVAFHRGEDSTVGKVGFYSLNDEGNPAEITVSLTWQELRKMTDALDEIAKTEKSGNIASRNADAAAKRAARAEKLAAQMAKLQAQIAKLQGDATANALSSDEAILADSEDEDSEDSESGDPEDAEIYPREEESDSE